MSAVKDIKKDPVIEMLKSELENDPKNELLKLVLYANPNSSGLKDANGPVYLKLYERINDMNTSSSGEFDYTDLELDTKSVSLTVRFRFAIQELVEALDMLSLARTRIHVELANGVTWPSGPVNVGGSSIKVGLAFIKSMKSVVREYLIKELPALIDDCYEAHYKNAGNFSYSLLETKLYQVRPSVMDAFVRWVESVILADYANSPDDTPIFSRIAVKGGVGMVEAPTRALMLDEMWVNTTLVKGTDLYKYPPHYIKLCKALCARLGKILRTSPNLTEEWKNEGSPDEIRSKIDTATKFVEMVCVGSDNRAIFEPSKKKDFQRGVYDVLMLRMNAAYSSAVTMQQEYAARGLQIDIKAFIRDRVINLINTLVTYSHGIGYQNALVYYDSFKHSVYQDQHTGLMCFKPYFTKAEFLTCIRPFATGKCNARVMETFYRFISTYSLVERDSSRKKIPESIEVEILKHADLSKFQNDLSDEPALVFSENALRVTGMTQTPIARLRDVKTGLTGLRQNGVMSLTAGLKNKEESSRIDQTGNDSLLMAANIIDEVADCYVMVHTAVLEARKAKKNKEAAQQRQLARHTGGGRFNGLSPQIVYTASSPAFDANVRTGYTSPTQTTVLKQEDLFHQAPVETQYQSASTSFQRTSPSLAQQPSQPFPMFPQQSVQPGQTIQFPSYTDMTQQPSRGSSPSLHRQHSRASSPVVGPSEVNLFSSGPRSPGVNARSPVSSDLTKDLFAFSP